MVLQSLPLLSLLLLAILSTQTVLSDNTIHSDRKGHAWGITTKLPTNTQSGIIGRKPRLFKFDVEGNQVSIRIFKSSNNKKVSLSSSPEDFDELAQHGTMRLCKPSEHDGPSEFTSVKAAGNLVSNNFNALILSAEESDGTPISITIIPGKERVHDWNNRLLALVSGLEESIDAREEEIRDLDQLNDDRLVQGLLVGGNALTLEAFIDYIQTMSFGQASERDFVYLLFLYVVAGLPLHETSRSVLERLVQRQDPTFGIPSLLEKAVSGTLTVGEFGALVSVSDYFHLGGESRQSFDEAEVSSKDWNVLTKGALEIRGRLQPLIADFLAIDEPNTVCGRGTGMSLSHVKGGDQFSEDGYASSNSLLQTQMRASLV